MLFLLSPAKKLDYDSPLTKVHEATQPLFVEQAQRLIDVLKTKSQDEIAQLMKLSDALAGLNQARYQEWQATFDLSNARQAVFAFNGDVYEGLQAKTLNQTQLDWGQKHVVILSGLYGVLRPMDLMRPYRLEMGTHLVTDQGKNLYEFWGNQISDYLNKALHYQKSKVIINLASDEYFKVVRVAALDFPVVKCVFQEKRNGIYKIISFNAKRARGLMTRYAIETKAQTVDDLKSFAIEEYQFDETASDPYKLVFRRG